MYMETAITGIDSSENKTPTIFSPFGDNTPPILEVGTISQLVKFNEILLSLQKKISNKHHKDFTKEEIEFINSIVLIANEELHLMQQIH